MKMTPEQKKIWVDALRSGEFEQGQHQLCCIDDDDRKYYCCLGVANEIFDFGYEDDIAYLHNHYALLDMDDQGKLADMNDVGKSFAEIADWIEENL